MVLLYPSPLPIPLQNGSARALYETGIFIHCMLGKQFFVSICGSEYCKTVKLGRLLWL